MNGFIRKYPLIAFILIAGFLSGCGDGDDLKAIINGQQVDLQINGIQSVAGGLNGVILPGNVSVPSFGSSLSILVSFVNGPVIDTLLIQIFDVSVLQPGTTYVNDQTNIAMSLTLNGNNQFVSPGTGLIQFNSPVFLQDGDTVDFDVSLNLPTVSLELSASDNVELGF